MAAFSTVLRIFRLIRYREATVGRISGLRGRGPEGRGLRGNPGQWEAASTAISASSAIRILQVTDYFGASSVPLPLSPSWRSRLKRFHEAVERHLRFLDIGGAQRISQLLILCTNSMPRTIRNEANARRTRQGRRKSCIDSKRVLVSRAGLEPATLLLKRQRHVVYAIDFNRRPPPASDSALSPNVRHTPTSLDCGIGTKWNKLGVLTCCN